MAAFDAAPSATKIATAARLALVRNCFLDRPSGADKSVTKHFHLQPCPSRDFWAGELLALKLEQPVPRGVVCLLAPGSPTTIIRLVVAGSVGVAIERVRKARTLSHICEKALEPSARAIAGTPAVADRDSEFLVMRKAGARWQGTATYHCFPGPKSGARIVPAGVSVRDAANVAAATHPMPGFKFGAKTRHLVPAVAPAPPKCALLAAASRAVKNMQMAEFQPGHLKKLPHLPSSAFARPV